MSAFRDSHISTNSHYTAHSSSPSTRPIVASDANMTSLDNGKAPANGAGLATPGRRNVDEPLVKIEPPRREDLQPSYARAIQPDDADSENHGWYGAMINSLGSIIGTLGAIPCCIVCPVTSLCIFLLRPIC